jgi:hypothetical protein
MVHGESIEWPIFGDFFPLLEIEFGNEPLNVAVEM